MAIVQQLGDKNLVNGMCSMPWIMALVFATMPSKNISFFFFYIILSVHTFFIIKKNLVFINQMEGLLILSSPSLNVL